LGISCGGTGCCGKTTFGIVTVDPGTDVVDTAVDDTFFLCDLLGLTGLFFKWTL
jgi:hypothetical protein